MRVLIILFAAAVLLGAATPLEAQVRLYGRVADENTGQPIARAEVILLDEFNRRAAGRRTDEAGRFEFVVNRPGPYRLRAIAASYRENTTPQLQLGDHSVVAVEIRLDPDVILLAPLEIIARSAPRGSPVLANYQARLRAGIGIFLTRADIERIRPVRVTDALASVPGIYLAGGGAGHARVVYVSRARGGACPAQIYVDGFHVNRSSPLGDAGPPLAVDDVVMPGSVEGIEIYRGVSTVPAEFMGPQAHCGVVAIWTRRGSG
jgi:hypothetical protein